MIVGAHRNPNQEQVIYGRPAAEAVDALTLGEGLTRATKPLRLWLLDHLPRPRRTY